MLIRYESPVRVVVYEEGSPLANVYLDDVCVDTINVWDDEAGEPIPAEARDERIWLYLDWQ